MTESNTVLTPDQEAGLIADVRTMLAGGVRINTLEERAAFLRQLAAKALANAAHVPLHKHGAFDDLQAKIYFLQLGAAALKGVGQLMEADDSGDAIPNGPRSDVAAIFQFFGEALETPALDAYSDMERLQRAAEGSLK